MTPEEFYKEIGADYQTALSRMMGNQGLLARMLKKFENDRNYEALEKAMEENDYEGIFAAAHTLKGVAGKKTAMCRAFFSRYGRHIGM